MLATNVIDHGTPILYDHLTGRAEVLDMSLSVHVSVMSLDTVSVLCVDPTELAEKGALSDYGVHDPVV